MNATTKTALEEGVLPTVTALLVALVAGDLLILSYGQAPGEVWRLMLSGTWGNAYGIGQVLYKATTLVFTGLECCDRTCAPACSTSAPKASSPPAGSAPAHWACCCPRAFRRGLPFRCACWRR